MDHKTIEFYNKNASEYAKWRSTEKIDLAQKIFCNELPSSGQIIDLGCGTGEKSIWFSQKGFKVDAVDASFKMLEIFESYKSVKIQQMDLNEIVFSKKYDGIWASFSIQHLEKKNQDLLFCKISKALNKKGIFYIGIHEGHKAYRDNLSRLYVPRTESELRNVLKNLNLRIFNLFREENFSFDNKPITIMHIYAKMGM
tara:strand:- start:2833 stop:3426 length:594 start_codon:yes stop_codon:yes gene_type:complete